MKVTLVSINCNDRHYSLGTYTLAATVKRRLPGLDVRVVNHSVLKTSRHVLFDLLSSPSDLYGFSVHHGHGPKILDLIRDLRNLQPRARIVLGGIDVISQDPRELEGLVDHCVVGEGEWAFVHLLSALSAGEEPAPFPCLVRPGELGRSEGTKLVQHDTLDEVPSPYLDGVFDAYDTYPTVYVETYRGCIWSCSFCYEGRGRRHTGGYSMARVEEELRFLLERRVPQIEFYDTIFNVNPERTRALLSFLIEHNRGTRFIGEFMLEWLEEDQIELLGLADFAMMEVGLQSVNEETLKRSGRKTDLARFRRNAELVLDRTNVNLCIDAMYGLENDAFEDFRATVDYIGTLEGKGGRRPTPILFVTNIHKGTRLYQKAAGDLALAGEQGGTVLASPSLSIADTRRFYELFYGYLFLRGTFPQTMNDLTGALQRHSGRSLSEIYEALALFLREFPEGRMVLEETDWTDFRANPLLRFFLSTIDRGYLLEVARRIGAGSPEALEEIGGLVARETGDASSDPSA
ncbi:MAG: B12-binding domain-containing radical SAM protein [Acidobacteria bacterium]|nr:B12-binding domain-containing radical SAM protein [Acidobacteriota bacterium]